MRKVVLGHDHPVFSLDGSVAEIRKPGRSGSCGDVKRGDSRPGLVGTTVKRVAHVISRRALSSGRRYGLIPGSTNYLRLCGSGTKVVQFIDAARRNEAVDPKGMEDGKRGTGNRAATVADSGPRMVERGTGASGFVVEDDKVESAEEKQLKTNQRQLRKGP